MAVKYVNDFAFDSGFGFSGSSGKTPVKSHMRSPMKKGVGGAVKAGPKAPAIAPAMVEKRSQGLGGLAKETKKLAAYDKPHMEGKKGAKVAQYAKGGAVKKAHAKKEMPSFLKNKVIKKAKGGDVPLTPFKPLPEPLPPLDYEIPQLPGRESTMPTGELMPLPVEPNYVGPAPRAMDMIQVDDMIMSREDAERMKRLPVEPMMRIPREPRGGFGPAPTSPLARAGLLSQVPGATLNNPMIVEKQDYDPGLANLKRRASLAQPVARRMAPQDRREMRADRREMARNIMDQYIAGPRRAMPAPRRAMPVAPRRPMIDRAMIAPPAPPAMYAKGGAVKKGQAKVGKVMGEFKRGELHSGSKQGPVVKNPKQAVAIALSEARQAGAKIPKKKAMGGRACD